MPATVVLGRLGVAPDPRRDPVGGHCGLALGEHACLRGSHARHVADGVDVGSGRLEREGVDGDPTVDREA